MPPVFAHYFQGNDLSNATRKDVRQSVVSDMDINHGWKLHFDLSEQLTKEEAFKRMGRDTTGKIIDSKVAKQFDSDLEKIGIKYDNFAHGFFTGGKTGRLGTTAKEIAGNEKVQEDLFANPATVVKIAGAFEDEGVAYKFGTSYDAGRQFTVYTQTLERRDRVISALESGFGSELVDQMNPKHRKLIGSTGVANHPISQHVQGRFTTDYLVANPDGTPNFAQRGSRERRTW